MLQSLHFHNFINNFSCVMCIYIYSRKLLREAIFVLCARMSFQCYKTKSVKTTKFVVLENFPLYQKPTKHHTILASLFLKQSSREHIHDSGDLEDNSLSSIGHCEKTLMIIPKSTKFEKVFKLPCMIPNIQYIHLSMVTM